MLSERQIAQLEELAVRQALSKATGMTFFATMAEVRLLQYVKEAEPDVWNAMLTDTGMLDICMQVPVLIIDHHFSAEANNMPVYL